jgi:amino acid adenylation domain-containing protein
METVTELLSHLASKGIKLSVDAGKLNCHAQKGTLTSDLQAGIVTHKAALIELLEGGEVPSEPAQPDADAPRERLPLSFAQERLWFLNELEPESAGYNVPGAVTIEGELDIAQVERALNLIIARHEGLRTLFPSQDGRAYQRILDRLDLELERTDLSHYPTREARDREARALCLADAARPFDLTNGPLLRGKVIRLAEHEHILMLNMHHIVSDGWSLGILIEEFGAVMDAFRAGRTPELPPLPIQYADYAVWQRSWLEEEGVLEQQLGYWKEKLAGVPESLDLPTDRPRPSVQSFGGANHTFALDAQLTARLKRIAEQQGGTLFMVLLAAFKVLLHRYTGQDDLCVGTAIANRQYGETEGLIGMFVNTLALRSQVDGDDSFEALLSKVKATCLEAYDNQDAPFEKVVDVLRTKRNMAISPLFQVMLVLQNAAAVRPDPRMRQYPLDIGISKFDLSIELTETSGELAGLIEYSTALYEPQTIARLARHFTALCQAIAATPTAEIRALDYLGDAEKQRLLVDGNATRTESPKDKCLPELFAEQAARSPEGTAVVCGGEQLTYAELLSRSRDLALSLQSEGVGPDTLVGVCMERSLDMVVALFGILEAGGAYVPLDPDYPDERLAHMLSDSGAAIVLTQERLRGKLAAFAAAETRLVALDTQWPEIRERADALQSADVALRRELAPHHLAYVIYTSGSTGRPKGVMVEHRNIVSYTSYFANRLRLSPTDRVLQFASLSFDTAAEEIFPALLSGACLVLRAAGPPPPPSDFLDLMEACGVTLLDLPTAYWHELAEHVAESGARSVPASIRAVVIGGEAASAERFGKWRRVAGDRLLLNTYGPTETTIVATAYTPGESDLSWATLPIGTPIANVCAYVLDERRQPVPFGVAGELYIGGAGVTRGYLGRPELTEERFIANPFRAEPGERLYRTGDRVRRRNDGVLEFLGRADDQVKIRGFRIEPGEIEAALTKLPAVRDAVVLAREDRPGHLRLVAYVVSHGGEALPAGELRAALKASLPDFMIPAAFVPLDAIPKLPNGKLDRRALARMDVTIESGQAYVAPRNGTETRLVEIWAEVLNLAPEKIGVDDNFFELGGHSLLATQLVSKIRSQADVDLPLRTVFERPSVAGLAEFIASAEQNDIPPILPADRSRFDRLPLSFAQERLWFLSELEPDSAGYNMPGAAILRGALDVSQVEEAFNRIIARHENLRTVFPSEGGRAHQRILDRVDFQLERIDLSHSPSVDARDREARTLCQADAAAPFDLAKGPLLRGKVIKLTEDEHILMLNMHHIISDGWSHGVLTRELAAILDGHELPALPIQYADYSIWQRQWLEEGGVLERQLAYWQTKLAGAPESLDLPADFRRPSVQNFAGARRELALDAELTAQLKRVAEREGATLYMVLLAAFQALLHRYSGQHDICVGSPIANRHQGETEGLIGMFVNTLAMRSRIESDEPFSGLLAKVKATCLEAYEHQDAPFEKIVELVSPQRNLAVSPLFQVMFILQNADPGEDSPDVQPYRLDSGISKFDLTLDLAETGGGLSGAIEYSTALYEPATIERMVEHFTALCRSVTAKPTALVRELELLGRTETHRLLAEFNATQADYPTDQCLHQLFVEQVPAHAGETALVCGEETLTYAQLHERSRDLALYLQSQGVEPDQRVGVCMERSPEMVIAMLGILQAGGAYVPLDPGYPEDRLAYMLRDSQASIVLTEEKVRALIPEGTRAVLVDRQREEIAGRAAALKAVGVVLEQKVTPRHLSHVIYTSGSTGQPKGVAIEHHSPVTLVHWASEVYSREELSGVLAVTSICFDLSVYEIFVTLANGGTIYLVPNALGLIDLAHRDSVTLINTVPSAMEELVRLDAIPESVQTVNLAGEPLSPRLVDRIYDATAARKVYDLYGPSEDTTYSTYTLRVKNGPQTIGRPIANTRVYILDPNGNIQPIGVPGELHIAGDGLARGYLNRAALTEEKFVANPFEPGTRMYRTGDLARWLNDGTLQYLGRIDTQVKVRGFRIEMGEIEARLGEYPAIQDCAVIARGEGVDRQLVAFYRAKDAESEVAYDELRSHLTKTLPDYMVPAAFVSLPAIPLNPNGKVDRRALSRMDVTMGAGREYVAPRSETEKQLVQIWAAVLNRAPETIGVTDNFFELGGHSLLATQLVSQIRGQMDVDLPLKTLFERGSVAQLAEVIASAQKSEIPAIVPADRTQYERLPLSFAQERLWFMSQLEPDSAAYNVPAAFRLHGELDADKLDRALGALVARHEMLRTVFPAEDGRGSQRILDRVDFRLERLEVPDAEAAHDICRIDATTPFDLANGPLVRGKLIRLGEGEHILLLNMHHIVSDGWSIGVLIKELAAILYGHELPAMPIQYADYAIWQRQRLETEGVLGKQLEYWQQKLAGVPESLDLPTDFLRPGVQSFAGATHEFTLDAELTAQLERLAAREGGTLYMVLLAAFQALLHRYTGQNDICVGSPIANRNYRETEGLIGMFVNTLAMRSQVAGDEPFVELLAKVKTTCLEAYDHQDAPFEKVVDLISPQRNLAVSPLFQVMLLLQNFDLGRPDARIEPYLIDTGISKFDLTFELTERNGALSGAVEYSTALYKPATIERMVEHFTALCRSVTAKPTALVRELELLGQTEAHRLLAEFNATRADYPADQCLHQLFLEQVSAHADETALVCGEETLTYAQLHARSHDLALYLQLQGVEPDQRVGVCMERSPEMVIAMLGVLQAGGAYVPLDPGYPEERLAYMLGDSQASIVLTEEKVRALIPEGMRLVVVDSQREEIGACVAALKAAHVALEQKVTPRHLSHVIYTSGSTGQPKGVAIEHHSPVTLVHWASEVYSREELSGVLAVTSICFDLSVYEIFVTLANGGTIYLVPNALGLVDLAHRDSVTLINTVPSAMEELVRLEAIPGSVQTINLAGEPLSPRLVDRIYDTTAARKVYDLYGPSEDTTYSTYTLRVKNGPQTIGRPIANTRVYILDPNGNIQPIGVPGELHIAGDGLARGYLNRAALTEEKFVANPFEPGTRMYRTGDLARWLDDGTLQYLGRIDTQVKVRGFRIEMGEIEARLGEHAAIQDCAVIARGEGVDRQLVAFYRAKDAESEVAYDELRAHLTKTLPDYMVPAAFVSLPAIPLNPNGKVDRRALSRMDVTMGAGREYVAPRSETEQQLVEIWAVVLNRAPETIGVTDNFFELGGHSLLATQLVSKIRGQMDVDLPLKTLFERGSVAQLAEVIVSATKSEIAAIVPADRTRYERLPLSFAQERLWFMSQLEPDSAGYNVPVAVRIHGELDADQLDRALNAIIARHETLRTVFPAEDGRGSQRILDRVDFRLERFEVTDSEAAHDICRIDAATPFDLANGPLIRGKLIRLAECEHIVLLNMHHIVTDGWSLGVLINELGAILNGHELPALPIQYADYAIWQRQRLEVEGVLGKQLAYWQQKLGGVPASLDLPTDFLRPGVQSFAGATHELTLDAELTARLTRLAEREGGTLYMVLLAAFQALLHRYTGQHDITVGSPIANRQYGETEGLIGMFVNTLAMRSEVNGDDPFTTLLAKVKATCLEAYEHQDAPFEKIVDLVSPQRNLAVSPLFQVMLLLQNYELGTPDARIEPYRLDSGISKFDLTFAFIETPSGLTASVEYSTALYKPATIERMVEHFTALCRSVTANPTARVRELELLGQTETHRLLAEFNATHADYPTDPCLHQLFVEQVPAHADETALVCGQETLTYAQLHERSHDLALYLQSQGVEPDQRVGVCMERSPELIVAMLAILQAGGAYVPLDPGYPEERLAYMLRDSQASLVMTEEKVQALIPAEMRPVVVDRQREEIAGRVAALKAAGVVLEQKVTPRHLSHVIYTSGSTGQPKGVAIEHHSPVTLVHWASEVYSREELSGVLAVTSICFDLSVYEIFVTLANGGTIYLVPNALGLIDLAHRDSVTLINTVPSAMEELVRLDAIPGSVQTVNLAGEPLSPRLVDRIYDTTAARKVYDLYGPSEDTTYSTYTLRTKNGPQTIGRPIANTRVYILDPNGNIQPIGVPGELHIAGDGLARGYLNRAALTEEKFVANPFEPGTRMYRTGDLARWLDDGTLQYLGRIDTQVKVRGFRIEMGEIEARLGEHPAIQDCAVTAQGEGAGKQLVAFYRAKDAESEVAYDELRVHLAKTLPDYMIPSAFVSLPAIPLNPNGKVDRRALSRMEVTAGAGREYVAPRNETEQQLVEIWAAVLNRAPETIGVTDNFFELGGHSLLATQLVSQIRGQMDVDLPLKTLFERGSVAELAEAVASAMKSEIAAIVPADRTRHERLPLSFSQERLWFMSQLEPDSAGYNVPVAVRIEGELDADELDRALTAIVARHETLRTVFPSADGRASQRILDRVDFRLERMDCADDETARDLCRADAATPFDLANGPLIRGKLIRLAECEHIVLLNMHHIVTDGWSLGVLIKELAAILNGHELPALPIQYADYAIWQRQWLEAEGNLGKQLAYWQQQLAGTPESLELPTDYRRPATRTFAGAARTFALDPDLTGRLRRLAECEGSTLYMVLLAAFKVLLYRYSGQNDISVGSPIANRHHGEIEGLVGMFVNTLVLRSQLDGDESFTALLQKVKATCLEAYEHQDAPFEKIVDLVSPERNLAVSPLFQVMLVLQNFDLGTPDQRITPYPIENGISKFDLTAELTETAEGIAGELRYSTALFAPQTIERMVRHFIALCEAIAATPAAELGRLDYLSAAETHQLLVACNATQAEYPENKCIHHLFAEQVAIAPDNTAIVFGEQQLTYRELYARSRGLAHVLRAEGVTPGKLVGLYVERSADMIVGLLAIWQAGGAYVPLDPHYPAERLQSMLNDAAPTAVLTQERLRAQLPETTARIIALDDPSSYTAPRSIADRATADDLAYTIYTSGSTGTPKGVMIRHGGVVNLWRALEQAVYAGHDDWTRVSVNASLSFDSSVKQLVQLLSGRTLVIIPEDVRMDAEALLAYLGRHQVDVLDCTPSQLTALLGAGLLAGAGRTPKAFLVGGEAIGADLWQSLSAQPDVAFFNVYGPTECTVDATVARIAADAEVPHLGRPIANTRVYVLDGRGQPVPAGVAGELHIGGAGVARGYWNRPELTAERFVADPFGGDPAARLYRTGDLARWLDDGTLQYLGRIDTQVKVRGFRIETGEIEAGLGEHPAIQDCAVVAQGEGAGKQLVAFYRADSEVPYDELRAHLAKTLPDYMVPAAFVSLPAIPLTPNGKVDRRALERMDVTLSTGRDHVAPRSKAEQQLVEIWAAVLNRAPETIGVHDNFFELGGHSLLATQLVSKIRGQMDVELPLRTLFERGSVAQVAEAIASAKKSDIPAIVPADRTRYERLPLSFAQERLWFMSQLEPDSAGYNIPAAVRIHGELDADQLDRAFNAIIARHETLRTVFPSEDGRASQCILERVDFRLERIECSDEEAARDLCRADAATPFDLASGPLLRGKLIRLDDREHVLLLNMHHIVTDGWSMGVLIRELGAILDGQELPAPPIQYADYSIWQRQWLEEGGALERQLAYWQQKLAGAPGTLDLPADSRRSSIRSFAGAVHGLTLDAELTAQLKRLAEREGGTLYMVLLAAFKVLLHRYSGQQDICVGSPIANRQYGETEGLIGMFVNTLALRSQLDGDESFTALLQQVRATCLEAYEHQDAPFEKIVDLVSPQRNMALTPLFQVMFILQNADIGGAFDERIQPYPLDAGISKFDLTAEFAETADGLAGAFRYSTALYKPQTIERMVEHFIALCRAIVDAPAAAIGTLDYLSESEQHQLLAGYNDSVAAYPADRCVPQLFAEQVAMHPDRTAIAFGDEKLTYQELDSRSHALALYLQSHGVGAGTLVGISMERSLDMVVALMGILRGGGAYVPLDPDYPSELLQHMLTDAAPAVVLTQERFLGALPGTSARLLALDRDWHAVEEHVADQPLAPVLPEQLAYVIYTSGSTGLPKGVMIEHGSLTNYLVWVTGFLAGEGVETLPVVTNLSFDASLKQIFGPLVTGGTVMLTKGVASDPEGLLDVLENERGAGLNCVPSLWRMLLEVIEQRPSDKIRNLRGLLLGGEEIPRELIRRSLRVIPELKIANLYGPTEATANATFARQISADDVSIGRPVANTRIYILDARRRPVPVGVAGEIYIGGVGVARGYLNRPELTAERFIADPFSSNADARLYRTGDVGRWRLDGNVEYLGRNDQQVKLRGYRIELGEIETQLAKHPCVREAVVIAREDEPGEKRLVAYVTGEALEVEELRAHLSASLPPYMVPAAFVHLEAMPLTPTKKIDRKALPKPEAEAYATKEYEPPQGAIEETLAAIWQELLHVERVGRNDDFFELGGHSLLATQLISRIRSRMDAAVPLSALFEDGRIAHLAGWIAKAEKNDIPPILPADRSRIDRLPLSFAQERLWFLSELEPHSAGYNIPGAVTVRGALDIGQVEEAFNRIIARHENLRTVFPSEEGQAHQQILDRVDFQLERIDLSHHASGDARDREARTLCQTDASAPFDLANGPLLRGKVVKLAEDEHILMLNMHHIISDGWSHGVLVRELVTILAALQDGREPELPPLPIQYADYSVWQRRWLEEGGVLERQLAYWQTKLAGTPKSLDLPADYPRARVRTFGGATHAFTLDADVTAGLQRIAEQQGGTLYMVLLAAFKALLHRYTGEHDICVGSPIANRQYGETEGLIGMFINTLALRSQLDGDEPFAALLQKVKATCLEAYEHQDAPFERIVDLVSPQRNMALTPLFQIMFVLQNAGAGGAFDERIQPYRLETGISKFDLTAEFAETADGLAGAFRYSTALFKPQTIERMTGHFIALCRAIVNAPAVAIGALDYLHDTEKHQLLAGYNDSRADYPADRCVPQLFAEQVAMHPDRTAIAFGDEKLTYQELDSRSHALALYLQSHGVKAGTLIGISMERSLDMVVALMGILRGGGAYVPLDPDYPSELLQHMLTDAAPAVVLTQERFLGALPGTSARLLALDRDWHAVEEHVADQPLAPVLPEQLAYVIYTSGSTGLPKGVMIEHGSLTNYLVWVTGFLAGEGVETLPVVTNLSFDASLKQIFGPLVTGGTVMLTKGVASDPEGLLDVLENERGAGLNCVPSLWRMLLEVIEQRPSDKIRNLRGLLLGGEEIPRELIRRSLRVIPELKIANLYGPTEATANATFARQISADDVSIGRPVANTRIYILDARRRPVPVGVAGEIYIGGVGVARGYLNRPELTAERFIADPFSSNADARLYRTGDVGRWRADGNVEYLGRNDQQVKLRGYRIELGEIETQLARHPRVREAVVIAREDEPGEKRLVAYVTGDTLEVEELRAHLSASVPQYMVPSAFVHLEALPLTPTKKVDRKALPKPEAEAYATKEYEPPQGAIEETLAAIWQELLHVERVGRNDDFFELGGHSLSAVQLMAKINRHFEQLLPLSVMFTAPSVAALAKVISSKEARPSDILIPIQGSGDARPMFAVPAAGGNVLSLQPLSKTLGAQRPFYGLGTVGLDGRTSPPDSVEETARLNIAALKTLQPRGPYSLIGHSYGGVVAYEMARILLEEDEEIASLTLLDSRAPSVYQETVRRDLATELAEACMVAAGQHDADVEIEVEHLRQLPDDEKIHHLVALLRGHGLDIDAEQFNAFYRVYRANQLCYRTYTPPRLSRRLEVSLYRAVGAHGHGTPADYGWNQLLQSPIRVHDVDADHFSILASAFDPAR